MGVLLPTLLSLWFPPRLGNDASMLTLSWNHFVRTGAPCSLPELDPANIAADTSIPLSWWSPGPIWLIGALSLGGLNFGQAISLCLAVTGWLQLAGWRRLYCQLGFAPNIAAGSLVLIAGSWHTLYSFRNFLGGDVFAAALLPWIALLLLRSRSVSLPRVFGSFTAALLLAVFFKLSFFITAAGLAAGACIVAFTEQSKREHHRRALSYGLVLGAALLLAWAIAHALLLRHGGSPADPAPIALEPASALRRALLPLVLPFASLVAFTSSGAKLSDAFGIAHLPENTAMVAVAAALAFTLHVALWRRAPSRMARGFVASVSAVYFLAFATLYLRGSAVSFEDRLFVPCGWFLLPGLLALGWQSQGVMARALGVAFVAIALGWGVGSYVVRVRELARAANFSARGYSLTKLPAVVEREVRIADRELPTDDALFASTSLECLLAVEHNRVAKLSAPDLELHGRPRRGIVVILPPGVPVGPQLARFTDYRSDEWHVRAVAQWNICVTPDSRPPSSFQ
ncbi:MAG TPA: hypothetical protein VK477_11035 [Acidobacteriota bacterium]|nr:hypothetical protein [Acidobacteriota bacterium]